jgi:hypothetical protein
MECTMTSSTKRSKKRTSTSKSHNPLSDKLSEILELHASNLDSGLQTKEWVLRPLLIEGFLNYKQSRINLGRFLHSLRDIYKRRQIWTLIAEDLGNAIGVDKRTIFRMVSDYEVSAGLRAPQPKASTLPLEDYSNDEESAECSSEQDVRFMKLLYYVEKGLSSYPVSKRYDAMQAAMEAKAHSWGLLAIHYMTITPKPSTILIRESAYREDAPDTILGQPPIWLLPERGTPLAVPMN